MEWGMVSREARYPSAAPDAENTGGMRKETSLDMKAGGGASLPP